MKKMIRIGFVLSLIISGFSLSNVVSAKEIKATEYHDHNICSEFTDLLDADIQPKGPICINCGGNSRVETIYSSWTTFQKTCTHEPFGTDEWRKRDVHKYYICTQCNSRLSSSTKTETEYVGCHGW